MAIPRIIMPICDDTLYTLKMSSFLYDKFWPETTEIDVVGYQRPDFDISNKINFVSIAEKQEGGPNGWSAYLKKHLETLEDELVILTLDDYYPTKSPDVELLEKIINLTKKDKTIGRFDLTWDTFLFGQYAQLSRTSPLALLEKRPHMQYRISTQPALWNREYLIKILEKTTSPWSFEIEGSRLSGEFPERVLAFGDPTYKNFPTYWIHKGAVSRHSPGKVNLLGLDVQTIREMVDHGLVAEKDIQWGMLNNAIAPSFHDAGSYDFDPSKLPLHESSRTNWREYYHIYNKEAPLKVNLFDRCFSHTKGLWGYISANGTNAWGRPKQIEYELMNYRFEGITIFTDHFLSNRQLIESVNSTKKVAWICEARNIHPFAYEGVEKNIDLFDLVITWDQKLIDTYDNCKLMPVMHARVPEEDWGVAPKTKMVSLIASTKRITPGHRYRFEVADKLAEKYNIDLWGLAFKPFEEKKEALQDYYFSITIHNNKESHYFTDALIDCFAVGTIPIFWGCPNIGDFFDIEGILVFDTIEELETILDNLTARLYQSKMTHVKRNMGIAQKYKTTVDDQVAAYLKEEFQL
tara:strand:- start:10284 stop:12017 length:1734 start_codon:yes stop_codon:yes gene_type:complete